MDDFGCYDYKKPAKETDQDTRTSYYRGHRYITDTRIGNKINAKISDGKYVRDPLLYKKQLSEYGQSYEWKYPDSDQSRNPSLNMRIQFIKPFEERKLNFIQRPMKPITSVTQETFTWRDPMPEPPESPIRMQVPVEPVKLVIDRSKQGFTKYLDPTATTMRLSYIHYTPKQVQGGIAAQDNITFWNWHEIMPQMKRVSLKKDEQMCDNYPAKDCTKRRCEYQNSLKSVPNSGLTTEVRENYLDPKHRKDYKEFVTTDIKPLLVHTSVTPFVNKSEYSMIGSGDPVVKYV